MRRLSYFAAHGAAALIAGALSGHVNAKELLSGSIAGDGGNSVPFSLSGESRRNVVGGEIVLGERRYEISQVSRHGLVGARWFERTGSERYAEFVVFSSSYTDQTAVGTPWVAARESRHCDAPYNAFVAVYRVDGESAVMALGPTPYPRLVDDVELSNESRVYCFVGKPPES